MKDATDTTEPNLRVEDPDHLKTVPGTERVIGTAERDPGDPDRRGSVTDRFRGRPEGVVPRGLGQLITPDP